jgi:predicted nucleic acid-binding protein
MKLAIRYNVYAYNAYYLRCYIENTLALLSLDGRMSDIAKSPEIAVVG